MLGRLPVWLANLLLLVLVVHLGWVGGQWTWRILWPELRVPEPQADQASERGQAASVRLRELELFGESTATAEVSGVVRETAPETSLRLTLHGVFMAAKPSDSSAILSGNGDDGGLYRVGDELPGNAELVAVEPGRILLRRQGEVESLSFEDDGMEMAAAAVAAEPPADREAFLDMASERLEEDPEAALAAIGFRTDADTAGYVYDGTNPELSQMNLQPGDIILSINGHELGDVERDREMMQEWGQADSLRLEIERGGTRFSFSVPLP